MGDWAAWSDSEISSFSSKGSSLEMTPCVSPTKMVLIPRFNWSTLSENPRFEPDFCIRDSPGSPRVSSVSLKFRLAMSCTGELPPIAGAMITNLEFLPWWAGLFPNVLYVSDQNQFGWSCLYTIWNWGVWEDLTGFCTSLVVFVIKACRWFRVRWSLHIVVYWILSAFVGKTADLYPHDQTLFCFFWQPPWSTSYEWELGTL